MTLGKRAASRKVRLDRAVVAAGIAATREKAQALILSGRVSADGLRLDKAGALIPLDACIELAPGARPFASRGGVKLAGALARLALDPTGWRCLDVGASTGGFTDALLRAGARHVTAVDVGRGVLEASLRRDPRVLVVEERNARDLDPADVAAPYDFATVDLSFISVTLVLERIVPLVPHGLILVLVKPQFEAGRREASRGRGVIRDPALRAQAVHRVAGRFAELGWGARAVAASELSGPRGNREIFLLAGPGRGLGPGELKDRVTEEVHRAAP